LKRVDLAKVLDTSWP